MIMAGIDKVTELNGCYYVARLLPNGHPYVESVSVNNGHVWGFRNYVMETTIEHAVIAKSTEDGTLN